MTKAKDIQKAFLTRVKSVVPANVSFVDELADLLNTSNDSAYRRLRGDTLLSIDEIALICQHFKVPFETQTQVDTATVSFNYFKLNDDEERFKHWLNSMCNNVKFIAQTPNASIIYAADDVPIWHHFFDKELISFKLFYWLKSILNSPAYAGKKYNPSLVDTELITIAENLLVNYNLCNSTEIWSEDTLNSTIKQVEYFWESGYFETKEQALRVCELLYKEVDTLAQKAEKSDGKSGFQLYQSDVMIGNNSILVSLNGNKMAYLSNNTFNMMSTTTPDFVQEQEYWLNNLLRKSTQISGVSEKQRNRFFGVLRSKIEHLQSRIQ